MIIQPTKQANIIYVNFLASEDYLSLYTFIEILNVLSLDEVLSQMTLQLKLTIQWTDTRLQYCNLNPNPEKNYLSFDEIEELWIPTIIFTNTKNRQRANFRNDSSSAKVIINKGKID